jgi:hypothetical protein
MKRCASITFSAFSGIGHVPVWSLVYQPPLGIISAAQRGRKEMLVEQEPTEPLST